MAKLTFKLNGRTVPANRVGAELKRAVDEAVTRRLSEVAREEARRRGGTPGKIVIKRT